MRISDWSSDVCSSDLAAGLVLAADHEAADVLQEYQRDAAPAAQLDEMRALQRGFREENSVVGEDADRIAVEMRESADQGRPVELLELVEFAAVDQARDDQIGRAHV